MSILHAVKHYYGSVFVSLTNATKRIKTIQMGDLEITIVNFADSTTILFTNITWISRTQMILKLYVDASSSMINLSKS